MSTLQLEASIQIETESWRDCLRNLKTPTAVVPEDLNLLRVQASQTSQTEIRREKVCCLDIIHFFGSAVENIEKTQENAINGRSHSASAHPAPMKMTGGAVI